MPQITSFASLVYYFLGSYFELVFIVWVLNVTFSAIKRIVYSLGGVKNGR